MTTTEYGTVEYYADLIRKNSHQSYETYVAEVALVSSIVDHTYSTDGEKVRLIENVRLAGEQVREQMRAGGS